MLTRRLVLSALIAILLLLFSHLMVRYGDGWLYSAGANVFMPGVMVETALSGNNLQGFGDWRTPGLVNAVTWLLFCAGVFVAVRLWDLVSGR
jgi:hypothetical protein